MGICCGRRQESKPQYSWRLGGGSLCDTPLIHFLLFWFLRDWGGKAIDACIAIRREHFKGRSTLRKYTHRFMMDLGVTIWGGGRNLKKSREKVEKFDDKRSGLFCYLPCRRRERIANQSNASWLETRYVVWSATLHSDFDLTWLDLLWINHQ